MKIIYTKEQLEYFRKQGAKGGKKTAKRLGTKHYSEMAKKGWKNRKNLSTGKVKKVLDTKQGG